MSGLKKLISVLMPLAAASVLSSAQPACSVFLSKYLEDTTVFRTGGDCLGYPAYNDRDLWADFLGDAASSLIAEGEKWLDYRYEYIPASVYLDFERTGDRASFGADGRARKALESLMLAELAEGKGRFMRGIVDGVWYFSEKISWVHPQHAKRKTSRRSLGDPDEEIIGITSAFTGVDVALAWHFFHKEWDKTDSSISRAVRQALDRHIICPYLDENLTDSNWWLGMTPGMPIINWCPWINFNSMLVFFLVEEDGKVLSRALRRSFNSMDNYMNYLRPDGGCDEGPGYWPEAAGKVFEFVSLMKKASAGRYDLTGWDRLKKMASYITDVYVGGGWVVAQADGWGRLFPSDTYPSLLYRYGKMLGDGRLCDLGLEFFSGEQEGDIINKLECMPLFEEMKGEVKPSAVEKTFSDAWYPDNEMAVLRRGKWYMFVLGHDNYAGPRNDTHNHDDVGEFVLFYDNMPVFIDMGKATATNGTYDKERYTFFHIRSESHNVPAINGTEQTEGRDKKAVGVSCNLAGGSVSMDIQNAYGPEACALRWHRDFKLDGSGFTLTESYRLGKRTGADLFRFMTRGEVDSPRRGVVRIGISDFEGAEHHTVELTYPQSLELEIRTLPLDDPTFSKVWGPELKQLIFKNSDNAPLSGRLKFRAGIAGNKTR